MTYNLKCRSCFASTAVFFICGVLLATAGCGRNSTAPQAAAGANASAIVDRNPTIASSSTAATNPSALQFASAANAGQATVSGTSTLHDWTVKGTIINGNAEFSGQWKADSAMTIALESIDLAIPVNSLKSTEGGGMDDTMYDALKLKQFPTITYHLTKASLKSSPSTPGDAYHFDTTGQLTVSGSTRPVNLDLAVAPHDGGGLTVTTDVKLKMTDFGVSPPTAMLGMIKSGDAITVKVTWELTARHADAKAEK